MELFQSYWQLEFVRHALLSAAILGPVCALLGVFVTLRGMSFFSDALAHASLTGVALGYFLQEWLAWGVDPMLVVLLFSFLLATGMAWAFDRTHLRPDSIIAFSLTGSVALGVVVISALGKYRLIDGLLFGSIFANSTRDIGVQVLLAVGVLVFVAFNLRGLTLMVTQPDLARVQGVALGRLNYFFALALAATVTVGIKMVGALLLTALIVIPATAAKLVAGNFRQMLLLAPLFGLCASCAGILISIRVDIPTGPTIVLTHVLVLLACMALGLGKRAR